MSARAGLAAIAQETVDVAARGRYVTAAGTSASIADEVARAKQSTRLYAPAQLDALVLAHAVSSARACTIEVTDETTAAATQRLVRDGEADVACLNFASAKNPGGGFLGGALAQEEDLARRSALYACVVMQPLYYQENKRLGSLLYADFLIWSPRVPFFRDDAFAFVPPWYAGVVTSPAPNAGALLAREPGALPAIQAALERRAAHVLAVLAAQGQRAIVLGAWGCGVFKNDPAFVADVFARLLAGAFAGAFARVVFAVHDRHPALGTLGAFRARFTGGTGGTGEP